MISLLDGSTATIPDIPDELLSDIYGAFEKHLEEAEQLEEERVHSPALPSQFEEAGIRLGIGGPEHLAAAMTHDPSQMHAPDLPAEILEKIGAIAKVVAPKELQMMPKAEPHCNCPHCQISRSIHHHLGDEQELEVILEEEVTEEDLRFRDWEVTEEGEAIYTVTNPLDQNETYRVHIGDPIGCTCGHEGCEHIEAVLRS